MAVDDEELNRSLQSLTEQIKSLQKKIEQTDAASDMYTESMRRGADISKSAILKTQQRIALTQKEIATKSLEISVIDQSITQKQKENAELKKKSNQVAEVLLATQMNIDRTKELANYVQSQINVARNEKAASEERINKIKQASAEIQSEIDSTQKKIASNRASVNSLESQIEIQTSIRAEAGRHIDKLKEANTQHTANISELSKALTQIRTKYKNGQKMTQQDLSLIAAFEQRKAEDEANRAANKATITKEIATRQSLSSSIAKMEGQIKEVATEEEQLKGKITILEGALQTNSDSLTKENITRLGLIESIGGMQSELKNLNDELLENQSAHQSLSDELSVITTRYENNEQSILEEIAKRKQAAEELERLALEEKLYANELKMQKNVFKKVENILKNELVQRLVELANGLKKLTESIYATQQKFAVSFDTAASLYTSTLIQSAKSYFKAIAGTGPILSQEQIMGAGQAYQKQFGTTLTGAEMERMAAESSRLGVSAEVYANAKRAFLGTGNEEATRMRAMSQFAKQGLSAGQALQFAADNADLLAIAGDKYSDSLFRAAAESKKIGVNLRDIEKFANSVVGDFEGSLENFAELSALGVEMDFNKLAEVAATGTPEEMQNVLKEQLSMSGITGEELQRNRQLRLSLTQTTGLDEASILRLTGVAEKPKEATLDEKQLQASMDANGYLARMVELLGGAGGIFSTVVGVVGKVASFAGAIYTAILARKTVGIVSELAKLSPGGGLATATTPPTGLSGSRIPPTPPIGGGGTGGLAGTAGRGLPTATTPPTGLSGSRIPPTPPVGGGGAGGLAGTAGGATSFTQSRVIQGAAAMLIVAASVYVLGKALQQFNTVEWASLAKAGVTIGALGTAIALAGPALSAGLSALANPAALIGLGAVTLALLGIGAAMRLAAPAFQAFGTIIKATFDGISTLIATVSSSISQLIGVLQTVPAGKLALIGLELIPFSVGLTALGAAALIAAPGLAALGGVAAIGAWVGQKLGLTGKPAEGTPKIPVGKGKAAGGPITGPGTSTSDNILTPTSPGEFVVNAKATQMYGQDMLSNINAGAYNPQAAPVVNNNVSMDTGRLETKLDSLVSAIRGMKVEMNGYDVGHVSYNEARTPLRVR